MCKKLKACLLFILPLAAFSQVSNDTTVEVDGKLITLSEVVISNKLNVASFIERVKNDTTFYKSWRQ